MIMMPYLGGPENGIYVGINYCNNRQTLGLLPLTLHAVIITAAIIRQRLNRLLFVSLDCILWREEIIERIIYSFAYIHRNFFRRGESCKFYGFLAT